FLFPVLPFLKSLLVLLVGLAISLALSDCGGGGGVSDPPLGTLPSSWSKYLSVGSIGATLDVYNDGGELQTHQDLTIDPETQTVQSPQFTLPIGATYRFIVVFHYQLSSSEQIPYAYADFNWMVDQFSESVSFSENDIRYQVDSADSGISADISTG